MNQIRKKTLEDTQNYAKAALSLLKGLHLKPEEKKHNEDYVKKLVVTIENILAEHSISLNEEIRAELTIAIEKEIFVQ